MLLVGTDATSLQSREFITHQLTSHYRPTTSGASVALVSELAKVVLVDLYRVNIIYTVAYRGWTRYRAVIFYKLPDSIRPQVPLILAGFTAFKARSKETWGGLRAHLFNRSGLELSLPSICFAVQVATRNTRKVLEPTFKPEPRATAQFKND